MDKGELFVLFKSVNELSLNERDALVLLYLRYYDGSSREIFFSDLDDKDEVLMLYDGDKLVGFTTHEIYDYKFRDKKIKVLYSGDTIIEREYWGGQKFGFEWAKRVGRYYQEFKDIPFYWFLIVKGHRTYRYLPAFFYSYYPKEESDSRDLKELLDCLAGEKFGEDYYKRDGIIRFETSKGYLKDSYTKPTQREKKHRAVEFFLRVNPNYERGDELACIASIKEENFKPLTKRLVFGS